LIDQVLTLALGLRVLIIQLILEFLLHIMSQQVKLAWIDVRVHILAIGHNRLSLDLLPGKVVRHAGLTMWHIDLERSVPRLRVQHRLDLFWVDLETGTLVNHFVKIVETTTLFVRGEGRSMRTNGRLLAMGDPASCELREVNRSIRCRCITH